MKNYYIENLKKQRRRKVTRYLNRALIISIFLAFVIIISLPDKPIQNLEVKNYSSNFTKDFENIVSDLVPIQNKDFYYYDSDKINYHYAQDTICSLAQTKRINRAFQEITKQTNGTVVFEENSRKNSIEIKCPNEYENDDRAGLGWIVSYVGQKKIINGSVVFYKPSPEYYHCEGYPDLEIHEILHAMGFGHIEGYESIMNPIASPSCVYLDKKISDCLIHIYGDDKSLTCEGIPEID